MSQTNILNFFSPKSGKRPSLDPTSCSPKRSKAEEEKSPPRRPLTEVNPPATNAVHKSKVNSSTENVKKTPDKTAVDNTVDKTAVDKTVSKTAVDKTVDKSAVGKTVDKTAVDKTVNKTAVDKHLDNSVDNTAVENNSADNSVDRSAIETKRMEAKMKLVEKATRGLINNVGPSWFKALEAEFSKDYMARLGEYVAAERAKGTVYPAACDVFSWTRLCSFRDVKVVILGQDPYHGPNQAHGLCFSVLRPTAPPPSLLNMYKELEKELPDFKRPNHGDLTGWAEQGVLLLNAVLTVRAHNANSHKDKGWERLTDAVVRALSEHRRGLVFVLWGAYAQKKGARIDKAKHKVLTGVHPSPLSASRGFFGCGHFNAVNAFLREQGSAPIDWSHLP